ncbi:MFS transporter [Citricoccus sp.]|uniref:MFS transporter n=1 Tax=Citricoccus sp. TaxID=1978372 RepID=UPI00261C6FD1|nr:MFS transporter [Citricoccus sp.]HRO29765.1 MFS transporter [Citricoccus sp.]HRO94163.1 MFS transporter [Citricoccus sp.]
MTPPLPRSAPQPVPADHDAGPRPIRPPAGVALASFTSSFDRFAVSPLLVVLATDLGASLAQALAVAGVYFLAYGFTQPVWGTLSDRFGRMRLMRVALLGAAVTGILSALAPNLALLIVARALTGVFFGGIIPTAITYIGDTVPGPHRHGALADNMSAVAVGTALATAAAGFIGETVGWRLMFAIPPVLALFCLLALRGRPDPGLAEPTGLWRAITTALSDRWMLLIMVLVFTEGAVVLGILTLLAPALQDQGLDATTAGLAVASYGLSTLVSSRLVRPLARRLSRPVIMALGGAGLVAGYAAVAVHVSVGTVVAAALLLGWTWALLHTSLQAWATEVLPALRGTAVALFAASLFAGSAVGTLAAGPFADAGQWSGLFGVTASVAAVLVVAAVAGRRAHLRSP